MTKEQLINWLRDNFRFSRKTPDNIRGELLSLYPISDIGHLILTQTNKEYNKMWIVFEDINIWELSTLDELYHFLEQFYNITSKSFVNECLFVIFNNMEDGDEEEDHL
jgi:hypothetical protein